MTLAGAAAMCGALTGAARASWTRPIEVSAPTSISVLAPQVASSPTRAAAVSFNEVNLDNQATASAFLALASPRAVFGVAHRVPGAQEVLAIAYSGTALELLTATGSGGQPCCATVQVIRRGPSSGFGRPQTLVRNNVGGGATGSLVPLSNGRLLAVIAGPQRLWATEASGGGRFGAVRGLTHTGSAPAAVAVAGTPGGGSTVVWTQGSGSSLFGASAGPGATPSRRHTLLALAPGHAIDGLQLAARPDGGLTVGWTESWNDAGGVYHSQAMAADLARRGRINRPRALSAAGDVASGLALTSNAFGDEVAAWDVCAPSAPRCALQSAFRVGPGPAPGGSGRSGRSGRRGHAKHRVRVRARWFGGASSLGPIDAGESPQVALAGNRESLIGWITGGRVALASTRPGAGRFATPRLVSGHPAGDLDVAFGPTGGAAVAAWTQGAVAPGVFASRSG